MLRSNVKKEIFDNIIEDMKKYNINPNDCSLYLDNRIDYEYSKIRKDDNNFKKFIMYDDHLKQEEVKDFSVVLDDFIGKDEKLNVYNSVDDSKYSKYLSDGKSKTVNYLFKKNKNSIVFDLCNLFSYITTFRLKYCFLQTVVMIMFTLILILLKCTSLLLFGLVDFIVFILFKSLKQFIRGRNMLGRKKNTVAKIFVSFFNLIIAVLKAIINTINNVFYIFNNLFNNNVESLLNCFNKYTNEAIYFNRFFKSKVNRGNRSAEQKNLIDRIKSKSLQILNEYLANSKVYIDKFTFSKASAKSTNPEAIVNPALKEYFLDKEINEKARMKNNIMKYMYNTTNKNIDKNITKLLTIDRIIKKILLRAHRMGIDINSIDDEKIYKDLDKEQQQYVNGIINEK